GAPAVVAEEFHGDFRPSLRARPVAQHARDLLVPVGERIAGDDDALAHDALGREAPAVDLRLHVLDDRVGRGLDERAGETVVHAPDSGTNTISASGGSVMGSA